MPPSEKPQVKRFVKNKPKPWFSFDIWSWRDRKIAAILLGAILVIGGRVVDTVKARFVPTEEQVATQEAVGELETTVEEVDEKEAQKVETKEWDEGGTLHQAGALDWQQATYKNKLATCADFVAKLWMEGLLAPELQEKIKTKDHVRVLAEMLVEELDKAMAPLPDAEENRKVYVNQSVSDMTTFTMLAMGWVAN
ncbi:MAG: hypothetical protein AAGF75_06485 [Cyanobacteria bacterium P01_H01_bin.130]